jgi:hypothetical protein
MINVSAQSRDVWKAGEPNSAVGEFTERLLSSWLPSFCRDPKRQLQTAGFRMSSINVSEADARDCLYAIDRGLVTDCGGGRYRASRSTAYEQLFWTGPRSAVPRTLTLWKEPVITFAALARLHRDHGWRSDLLGTQPRTWAFDLAAHDPSLPERAYILCEVKKTTKEADRLLSDLLALGSKPEAIGVLENSKRKWQGILADRPKVVWILGPSCYTKVLSIEFLRSDRAALRSSSNGALDFPGSGSAGAANRIEV